MRVNVALNALPLTMWLLLFFFFTLLWGMRSQSQGVVIFPLKTACEFQKKLNCSFWNAVMSWNQLEGLISCLKFSVFYIRGSSWWIFEWAVFKRVKESVIWKFYRSFSSLQNLERFRLNNSKFSFGSLHCASG